MKSNILASIALFQNLYDNNNDIFSVVGEFIKAAINSNNLHYFDITKLRIVLRDDYDIDAPEAVIKTVLKRRLKTEVTRDSDGNYLAEPSSIVNAQFKERYLAQQIKYKSVADRLANFFTTNNKKNDNQDEKDLLMQNFASFLLKPNRETLEYDFSKFILSNEHDSAFIDDLNDLRESYVIFSGIKDVSDSTAVNSVGAWESDLVIYMDTEHLFSFFGYNGVLYEEILNDFYRLIQEANRKTKRIKLLYFYETKKTIDSYFNAAVRIKNGKSRPNGQVAMNAILSRCDDKSDILVEQGKFYAFIKSKGILIDERAEYITDMSGNVQTKHNLDVLTKESLNNEFTYQEDDIAKYLRLFSIINNKRKENNKTSFEHCKYILMSANRVANFVAWHPEIKNEKDFSFSSDIDFITSRLWFRLHKGLIGNKKPLSFDILTKAKIIIASLLYTSTHKKYEDLSKQTYSKDEEISVYNQIRSFEILPEDITNDNINEINEFIEIKDVEVLRREQSILINKAKQGEDAIAELLSIKRDKRRDNVKNIIRQWHCRKNLLVIVCVIILMSLIGYITYVILSIIMSDSDTCLSLLSFIISCIVLPVLGRVKSIRRFFYSKLQSVKRNFIRKKINNI